MSKTEKNDKPDETKKKLTLKVDPVRDLNPDKEAMAQIEGTTTGGNSRNGNC